MAGTKSLLIKICITLLWASAYSLSVQFKANQQEVGIVQRDGKDFELLLSNQNVRHVAKTYAVKRGTNQGTVIISAFFFSTFFYRTEAHPNNTAAVIAESWELLSGLFGGLQYLGLDKNLVAACGSYDNCRRCWAAGFPVFLTPSVYQHNSTEATTKDSTHELVLKIKWLMAYKFLDVGYDVLFLDWDIGFTPNPDRTLWEVIDAESHDIMALWDWRGTDYQNLTAQQPQAAWSCPVKYPFAPNPCASTAVWHARASNKTAAFSRAVWETSILQHKWEQLVFNELVMYWGLPLPIYDRSAQLQFKLFPYPEVCNLVALCEDKYVASQFSRAIIVHCAYINKHRRPVVLKAGHRGHQLYHNYTREVVKLAVPQEGIPVAKDLLDL